MNFIMMTNSVLLGAVFFPLVVLLVVLGWPKMRVAAAWSALPALLCGLMIAPSDNARIAFFPNFLLGTAIGLDRLGRVFLLLTACVWLLAGVYARSIFVSMRGSRGGKRFCFFYLLTLCGNLGVTIAQDAITFYVFFAVMTIAGYGLIVHARTKSAFMAGRFYIVFSLIGEMLILAGMTLAVDASRTLLFPRIASGFVGTEAGDWAFLLFFIGFGVKVGLVPLHVWLPRSYFAAPIPVVAILSGAMTKAGVLGWLRFLPVGSAVPNAWSGLMLVAGVVMVFYGVVIGLVQTRVKTILAFSSLSQMGYLTIATATKMGTPGGSELATGAVARSLAATVGYTLHHGVTKLALFLGLGVLACAPLKSMHRRAVLATLVLGSLSLIGFPLTSGAFAKAMLKSGGAEAGLWHSVSGSVLFLGTIGTILLMTRFLILAWRFEPGVSSGVLLRPTTWAWGMAVAMSASGFWSLPWILKSLGFGDRSRLSFVESVESFLYPAVTAPIFLLLTHRMLVQRSQLTLRPPEGFLKSITLVVRDQWIGGLRLLGDRLVRSLKRMWIEARVGDKFISGVERAANAQTGWRWGMTLFMLVWSGLIFFLAMGIIKLN